MVRKDFNSIFDTLCDYYGQKEMKENDSIREIYFGQLKYYEPQEWIEIQNALLGKHKYMPKVQEIIAIASDVKATNKETVNVNIPVCDCTLCNGTGYRFITEPSPQGNIYTFVVACDCANGNNKLYDGRTIKDKKNRSNYICPRYSSIMPT